MITVFFEIILPFLKQYWKAALIGAFVLSIVLYIAYLRSANAGLEQDIVDLKGQLVTCQDNSQKLQDSLTAINQSLGVISTTMDATSKQFVDLNATILKSTTVLKGKMDKFVANDIKPIDCQSTIKYLIDAKKEYTK